MTIKPRIVVTCDSLEIAHRALDKLKNDDGITLTLNEDMHRIAREWTQNKYKTDTEYREKVKARRRENYRKKYAEDEEYRAKIAEYNKRNYQKLKNKTSGEDASQQHV